MKKLAALLICISFLCVAPASASAEKFQVGVSPAILDMGEIEKADSKVGEFNILTPSDESFMVDIKKEMGSIEFFDKEKYREDLSMYSEQEALEWIDFINNPVYLDTRIQDSGMKKAEKIKFLIKVPEDAEPGYHVFYISPKPQVPGGRTTGVSIVAITKIEVVFKVPGEAVRNGEILDILAFNENSRTRIEIFFQNTGTLTMSARANEIKAFNETGGLAGETKSSLIKAGPGEVAKLMAFINRPLEGNYHITADVSYFTGETNKEADVFIERAIVPATTGRVAGVFVFPWWIIIIVIIAASYVIYRWV